MSCLPSPASMLRVAALWLLANATCAQNIWVNEFHYDNAGTDQNEFIEVVLENPSNYALSDFTISLYSGTTLATYASKTLNNFTPGSSYGNMTIYYFMYPVDGIQNNTSGIAIDYRGSLLSFISYEGNFTATSGIAGGVASHDVGVQESATTPTGYSLQLAGSGNQYDELFWTNPSIATPGQINQQQTLTALPTIMTTAPISGYDFGLIMFGKHTQTKSYSVIGANLTSNLVITPPSGFELSLTTDFTNVYTDASPLTLLPVNGTINATMIYIRFTPTAGDGNLYGGDVNHKSLSASDADVPVTGREGEPNAWINEFHYNDVGVDANEFIEIVVKNAGNYDLQDFSVLLYDGSTGKVYDQETLDNFNAGQTFASYSIYSLDFTNHSFFNIENGPDGIALAYQGNLILFISYQGSFMATDGPAAGTVAENLAPSENNSTPENSSLYLVNALTPGATYADLTWAQSLGSNTMGQVNPLEVLPVALVDFTAIVEDGVTKLSWATVSEMNNNGFEIERSADGVAFADIGFIAGYGTSTAVQHYKFEDNAFNTTAYYRLRQTDLDGKITYSSTVFAERQACSHFFPNPATPESTLSLPVSTSDVVRMLIVDQCGVLVLNATGTQREINGVMRERFLSKQNRGCYYLQVSYSNTTETIKVVFP